MPTDPALYELYQENLKLRELLVLVAQDLERLAARVPASRVLLRRAMRILRELRGAGWFGLSASWALQSAGFCQW